MYPPLVGNATLSDVTPDILFELFVPLEVALERLDENDPKYAFRKKIIEETHAFFYQSKERLPLEVQDRIVTIDSTQPIHNISVEVFEKVFTLIQAK